MEAIEVIAPSLQPGIVLLPGLHRVSIHPGGVKNRLPQLLHRLIPAQLREQLLGPSHAGDGGNAPLLPVLPPLDIGPQNGVAHLPGLGNLIRPHTLQAVRIFGDEVNPAGQHLAVMLLPGSHPVLHLSHGGNALVAAVELLQRLIAPLHRHLFGLGLVGLIHHHGHKLRLVQVCIDNDLLSLLDIHAAADNQPGIFPQYCFFHRFFLLRANLPFVPVCPIKFTFLSLPDFSLCVNRSLLRCSTGPGRSTGRSTVRPRQRGAGCGFPAG